MTTIVSRVKFESFALVIVTLPVITFLLVSKDRNWSLHCLIDLQIELESKGKTGDERIITGILEFFIPP
jgi:hypothetical protein